MLFSLLKLLGSNTQNLFIISDFHMKKPEVSVHQEPLKNINRFQIKMIQMKFLNSIIIIHIRIKSAFVFIIHNQMHIESTFLIGLT